MGKPIWLFSALLIGVTFLSPIDGRSDERVAVGQQRVTLLSRKRHDDYEKATFSFEFGVRDDPKLKITRNDWDLEFGNGGDFFSVTMITDDRSVIRDLGVVDLAKPLKIPVLIPYRDPYSSGLIRAVAGHTYLVHTKDGDTDQYAVFRVEKLVPNDRCTIVWRVIPAPKKSDKAVVRDFFSPFELPKIKVDRMRVRSLLEAALGGKVTAQQVDEAVRRAEQLQFGALYAMDAARARFERAEATASRELATRIAEQADLVKVLHLGDVTKILNFLSRGKLDPAGANELIADPKRFASLFESPKNAELIKGTTIEMEDPLQIPHRAKILLPPGIHTWNLDKFRSGVIPRDLVIQGAGMDQTLVRINTIRTNQPVVRLTFRDLTLDCNNRYMTDLRTSPAALRLQRCRVVRFDMGAGASVMVSARTAAMLIQDCELVGGYGRAPGTGSLFRVGRGMIARIENTKILGPLNSAYDSGEFSSYHFANCRFEQVNGRLQNDLKHPRKGVILDAECRLRFVPNNVPVKTRSLADFNPNWAEP